MDKRQVRSFILDYMKKHNISGCLIHDGNKPILIEDRNTIYISFSVEQAPDRLVECSIWLYENVLEVRAYYSENAASWCRDNPHKIPDLLRVINYINAQVFLGDLLFTPRLYIAEHDAFDVAISTIIPYDFFTLAPIESCEFITAYYPEFLGKMATPLFGVLCESIPVEQAIDYIKTELMGNEV